VNLALANMIAVLAGQVLLLATPAGLDRALATSESGAIEEIIFAVRQPQGPHWYENLGSAITDVNDKAYGSRRNLCKLNLKSEKVTLLLEYPRRAVPTAHNKVPRAFRKPTDNEGSNPVFKFLV